MIFEGKESNVRHFECMGCGASITTPKGSNPSDFVKVLPDGSTEAGGCPFCGDTRYRPILPQIPDKENDEIQ